jgi:hypothetical protein
VNELEAPKNWMDFWLAKIPAHPGLGVWSRAVFFVIEGGLPYLTRLRPASTDGFRRARWALSNSANLRTKCANVSTVKKTENSSLIFLEESNESVLEYFALKTCTQRANNEKWRIPYRL